LLKNYKGIKFFILYLGGNGNLRFMGESRRVAHVARVPADKCDALSSNPSTVKKKICGQVDLLSANHIISI
jgi:hypothetical protein